MTGKPGTIDSIPIPFLPGVPSIPIPSLQFGESGPTAPDPRAYSPEVVARRAAAAEADRRHNEALAKQATEPVHSYWDTVKNAAQDAMKSANQWADYLAKANEELRVATMTAKAARLDQSKLKSEEAGSYSDLARSTRDLAAMTALGPMGAIPEIKELNATIEREIGKLHDVLGNISETDEKGIIEANKIRTQIVGLRAEERQNLMDLQQSIVDGYVGMALGSVGRFEKIIISGQKNIAAGLEKGLIPEGMPGLGNLQSMGLMPIHPVDLWQDNPQFAADRRFKGSNVQRRMVGNDDTAGHLDAVAHHAAHAAQGIRNQGEDAGSRTSPRGVWSVPGQ